MTRIPDARQTQEAKKDQETLGKLQKGKQNQAAKQPQKAKQIAFLNELSEETPIETTIRVRVIKRWDDLLVGTSTRLGLAYLFADEKERKWKRRQRGTVVGRIYFAHPTAGDRYYLRLLLNHVKGAKSYNDIKTFNGTLYEEYKDACIARGLLEDDGEWHEALKEASTWSTAKALRQMFVTMLLHCEITNPLELWNEHWKTMSEDIENKERLRRKRNDMDYDIPDELIQNIALCKIEILLNKNNKSIKDFKPLPFPDMSRYREKDNRLIEEELQYNVQQLKIDFQTYYEALNEEQKIVYDNIIHAAENDLGGLYFVYGSGGTGKTFLWKTILAKIRSQGKIALAVASSGISSLLLPGGRTAHSRFKIPLEVDEYSTCSITKKTHLAELIRAADIIIWDEAPMNHKHVFEAIDKTFRDIMEDETKIFGGKTMVLGGDFRQTLPVIPKGTREDIISASINKSYLWKHRKMFELKTNMRLRNDKLNAEEKKELAKFSDWVLQIGEGRNPTIALTEDEEKTWINLPKDLIIEKGEDPVKNMIDETFPNIEKNYRYRNYIRDRCILTPTNEKVEEVNTKILSMIPTQGKIYKSADSISPISGEIQEQDILYPQESLNALNFPGMPPHSLELKVGIPIMLIRNINPSSGLCNGTRLIITKMEEKCIQAEIVTGSHVGDLVNIHRIQTSSQPTSWEFILRRRQFPIKICFAMTINKSQGQTLQKVGLFLPRPVFNHGQLYVAVSRTTSKKGLKIIIETKDGEPENHTKNIVYDEIFEELQPDMSRYREKDNRLIEEELQYNVQQLKIDFQTYYEALNEEQKIVYDNIIHAAENDLGGLYFVYGSGGTGKTFLWKTILAKIRSQGKIALAVASSGISSLLLPGGRTAHSRFKIPLEVDEYSTCSITKKTHLAELIRAADIIIWDEAPMNHKHVFEAIDKTFRDIMEDETKIFGGKTMVLGGDFRQTLPVIPKGTREDIISASINKSYLWKHRKMFELKTNMRLRNDKLNAEEKKELAKFSDWVLQIGEGRNPTIALTEDEEKTWINLPKDLIIEKGEDPVKNMIDETFPNIEKNYRYRNYIRDRCILTPTNEKVEEVNTKILSMIPTQGKIYKSADSISPISGEIQEQDILYPQESLNALNFPGMPPHSLELKVGIPIMLIRNINPSSGLCNGTRLIITKMEEKCIQAEIVTGSHVGDLVNIHRIQTSSQPTSWEFILRRRQFPIKICFAMTINKSQGQTLQKVGLFLPRPVFNHGQLYVAVSRTTSKKGLKIIIETKDGEPENHTKNIVYDEIFEELQPGTNEGEPYI